MKSPWIFVEYYRIWCLWNMVLEKTPESPWDSKEIKPVNLKGNQPWILIGRTDAEAEAPVFWSPAVNSQLFGKVPDAGTDWGHKKRASEDEMAGYNHWCNGHGLGQTSGDGEEQGGLVCFSPWDCEESDMTWTPITRTLRRRKLWEKFLLDSSDLIPPILWLSRIDHYILE